MNRTKEMANIVQVGIRNVCMEEKEFIDKESVFLRSPNQKGRYMDGQSHRSIKRPCLSPIDLDCFDPSYSPLPALPYPEA